MFGVAVFTVRSLLRDLYYRQVDVLQVLVLSLTLLWAFGQDAAKSENFREKCEVWDHEIKVLW
jgi:hypothetical protein